MTVPVATVAAMLAAVREAALADDGPRAVVSGFHDVVGVDYATYDEFGPDGARVFASPAAPEGVAAAFARYGNEHPSLVDFRLTGEPRTRRLSDIVTQRRLRRLGLWSHVFRPLGIRYQLNLTLHASGGRVVGVGLSRVGRDFTDDEVLVAELLRVELGRVEAARRGPSAEAVARHGLTAREAEVLALAARNTSAEIAGMLSISRRTVEKHLEHAYEKLGVSSRPEALAMLRPAG